MKSKVANAEVRIILSESGITLSGPYNHAEISWEGIERIVETPKGVFIWPQKGVHICLPTSDVVHFVTGKRIGY
ncbi:MAG: YcxB family protein [Proteobacteria bacterium]|nr:YcxB family protein [Pseudomonadota bacterium]